MAIQLSKQELQEKYSDLIPTMDALDDIEPGWFGLIANLCHTIRAQTNIEPGEKSGEKTDLYFKKMRVENGGIVFELVALNDALMDCIQDAESLSHQICARCMGGKEKPNRRYCSDCRHGSR